MIAPLIVDRDPATGWRVNQWPSLSKPLAGALIVAAAYGVGVQSTAMLLMAAHGEIGPMPHVAINADTRAEFSLVYEHLQWMHSPNVALPFPIETVSAGDLRADVLASATSWTQIGGRDAERSTWKTALRVANPPFFTRGPRTVAKTIFVEPLPLLGLDGKNVEIIVQRHTERETYGMLNRSCTRDYKIDPITKALRKRLGLAPRARGPAVPVAELWIGLTTDESDRIAYADQPWIQLRWPLIEIGFTRADCIAWLIRNGYPVPPKSRCYFCPFQSNELWLDMKLNSPGDWAAACEFDRAIRHGIRGTTHLLYLHEGRTPLEEVDLSRPSGLWTADGLRAECMGACGL